MRPRTTKLCAVACAVGVAATVALAGPRPAASGTEATPGPAISRVLAQVKGLKGTKRAAKLYQLAKQEDGKLSLYTSMTNDVVGPVVEKFEAQFDGIDVEVYRAGSETVLQRLLEEKRAGFRGADIVETNGTELAALQVAKALLPYQSPNRTRLQSRSTYKTWTATRFNKFVISWNTNLVAAGQQPKRWEDLAAAKWKGKLALEASDVDWYMSLFTYWTKQQKGRKKTAAQANALFEGMARNSIVITGHTTMASLLGAGQYAVGASNYSYLVKNLQQRGAPVAFAPVVQPVFVRANGVGLVERLRRPATAILFIDWILNSGQPVLRGYNLDPARRDLADPLLKRVTEVRVDLDKFIRENKQWSDRYERLIALGQKGG
jgi:iron(III) transport system substrate-binding protein